MSIVFYLGHIMKVQSALISYHKMTIVREWVRRTVSDDWEIRFLKVNSNSFNFLQHKLMMQGDAQIQNCVGLFGA